MSGALQLKTGSDEASVDQPMPDQQTPPSTQIPEQPEENETELQPSPSNSGNESIRVLNTHIWVTPNGTSSVGALVVQNTGGTTVSVSSITVARQSVPLSSWWYSKDPLVVTASNMQRPLTFDATLAVIEVTGAPPGETFQQTTRSIPLKQGEAMFLYLANPAGMTAVHGGLAYTMNVQAGKASAVNSVSVMNG
jgi:hypothetical protein